MTSCSVTSGRYDDYYSPSMLANLSNNLQKKDFFVIHFNVRSLSKNKDKIEECLNDINRLPDAIATSETKLNATSSSNIGIRNYHFFHNDSLSMAGGVGIYLKNTLKHSLRNDLSLKTPNCEDLWIEVESETSNFCLGVVYRHPKKNFSLFQNKLYLQLHDFETTNINYVVCGGININTLLNNPKISEYIAALNSIGCNQMVDVPTRFANNCKSFLLNHVYTNITKETYCEVCLHEISDHLPTFFVVPKFKCCLINKRRSIRCMKYFNLEDFLVDMKRNLSKLDFDSPNSNINNDVCNLINIPLKQFSMNMYL